MFVSAILRLVGFTVIDKRGVGNCLWVVPMGQDFTPVKDALAQEGIDFHFRASSKTVRRTLGQDQPAWWTTYQNSPAEQLTAIESILQKLFGMKDDLPTPIKRITPPPVMTDKCIEVDSEKDNIVKQNCYTCAFGEGCHEAFTYYNVGCDKYVISYQYAN